MTHPSVGMTLRLKGQGCRSEWSGHECVTTAVTMQNIVKLKILKNAQNRGIQKY